MTKLTERRRGLLGDALISGNGFPYQRVMTVEFPPGSGCLPWNAWLSGMGVMPELEEICFTGSFGIGPTGAMIGIGDSDNFRTLYENAPNLKRLRLKPTSGAELFKCGHYAFKWLPASVTLIELGSQRSEGLAFSTSGYFRRNNAEMDPPWTAGTKIGNVNGLTILAYLSGGYSPTAGFMDSPMENTRVLVYDSESGDLMTSQEVIP